MSWGTIIWAAIALFLVVSLIVGEITVETERTSDTDGGETFKLIVEYNMRKRGGR